MSWDTLHHEIRWNVAFADDGAGHQRWQGSHVQLCSGEPTAEDSDPLRAGMMRGPCSCGPKEPWD